MRRAIYLIFPILYFVSCKEVYDPELVSQRPLLVVDGLITDEFKPHKIRLSRTVRFDSLTQIPETGATVYVQNQKGETFMFKEKSSGNYYSDTSKFRPITGDKYTLFINTKDGKTYTSNEQELLPKSSLKHISNKAGEVSYYLTVENKVKKYNINGADFTATQSINSQQETYCRFSNTMLVEFTSITEGVLSYCWRQYEASVYPIISEIQNSNAGEFQHKLGFMPLNVYFFGIYHFSRIEGRPPREIFTYNYLYHYFVTIKQYHMNKNIFDIYKLINKQLKAEDKIFDPVNLQIGGNIKCTSDPKEPVYGLFDVSSVSINTFMIDSYSNNGVYNLTPLKPIDFDTIPKTGFVPDVAPVTWIR